jgi:hypothetical protein
MLDPDDAVDVYVGTAWQAGQVQGLLESAGIVSFLKDEAMGTIEAPALAPGGFSAVKVIVSRHDRERAEQVVSDFGGESGLKEAEPAALAEAPAETWRCTRCNEQVEGQFDVCWSCGSPRPAGS